MFKEILDKLSLSSKEAVVDGNSNSLDEFKEYLHVERQVESLLGQIVVQSIESEQPRLIMISGNVGDGKSHLLAKLYGKYPEAMASIAVKNDATESNFLSKSWLEELDEFLMPFRDESLEAESVPQVRIVAINLGVLSRFIHEKPAYGHLAEFVKKKGILENLAYENFYHRESIFQFINLADFKLFNLSAANVNAPFLEEILKKITTTNPENPFMVAMKAYYADHPYLSDCIIRENFLQLSDVRFQKGLTKLLVHLIVRFKLIISIRDLLDFIYDLLVPYAYQQLSSADILQRKDYNNVNFQLQNSVYNKLFESEGRSAIFNALASIDPMKLRSESLDDHIFALGAKGAKIMFDKWKLSFAAHFEHIVTLDQRKAQVKAFVRSLYLNHMESFEEELEDFERYCQFLFYYHVGDKSGLMPLYNDVILAIKSWNGHTRGNEIHIPMGEHQITYSITQKIKLGGEVLRLEKKDQHALNEFETSFPLQITVAGMREQFTIDFNLYLLIRKVVKGYCPSRLDREDHVDFQKFVERITRAASSEAEEIRFEEIDGGESARFELRRSWDGYHFERL